MTQFSRTFVEATGLAKELNLLVRRQTMFCIEHFLVPKLLVLGRETAHKYYGSIDVQRFVVEGYEIPIEFVDGDFLYLVGEKP